MSADTNSWKNEIDSEIFLLNSYSERDKTQNFEKDKEMM